MWNSSEVAGLGILLGWGPFMLMVIAMFFLKTKTGDAILKKRAWKKLCKQFPSQKHIQHLEIMIQHKKWIQGLIPNMPPFEPSDKTLNDIWQERELQWRCLEGALERWKNKILTWHQYTEKAFTKSRVSWEIIEYHQNFRIYLMMQRQQLLDWINGAPFLSKEDLENVKTFQ